MSKVGIMLAGFPMRTAAAAVAVAIILVSSSCGSSDGDAPGGGEGSTDTEAMDEGFAAGPPRPGVYHGSGRMIEGLYEATGSDDEISVVVEPASDEPPFGGVALIEADCAGRRFEVEVDKPDALKIEAKDANDEPVNVAEEAKSFRVGAFLDEGITESFSDTELSLQDIVGGQDPSQIQWFVGWSSTESVTVIRSNRQEPASFDCYWEASWQSER